MRATRDFRIVNYAANEQSWSLTSSVPWLKVEPAQGKLGGVDLYAVAAREQSETQTQEFRRQNQAHVDTIYDTEYQRFTRLNRILHIIMIVSFLSLALTGMTLKFSYTGWAAFLSHLFGGFESAGYIHRFAAVAMFGIFVTHLVDLFRRVRREYGGLWKMLLVILAACYLAVEAEGELQEDFRGRAIGAGASARAGSSRLRAFSRARRRLPTGGGAT